MKIASLLYHDVVEPGDYASSGFVTPDANIYKLTTLDFDRHLAAIHARTQQSAVTVERALLGAPGFLLTFDDGGVTALTQIAARLEHFGSAGHFFITTDQIGTPGFLTAQQIRDVEKRGHVIGSHSCSHPLMMSALSVQQLEREWAESTARLADILGHAVTVASVPGGSYSRAVGKTAAAAGIRTLFTSEPTTSLGRVDGCTLLGRFSVQQSTHPDIAARLAIGDGWLSSKQWLYWNFKKVLKRVGGQVWLEFRKALLARRGPTS